MNTPTLPPRALALCLLFLALSVCAQAQEQRAPTEFRGLDFGAALEDCPGLEPVADLVGPAKAAQYKDVYYRPDEKLTFGEADILSVAYVFRENLLRQVMITMEGETNTFLVKELLISSYGPGRQVDVRYGWTWPDFSLVLASDPGGRMSVLTYTLEK